MLVRLIYSSTATRVIEAGDLHDILASAQRHNKAQRITGILYHGNFRFVQCLEGDRANVNKIYNKIIQDPRHTDLVLLDYQYVEKRLFGDWTMGFVSAFDESAKQFIYQLSQSMQFEPEVLTAEAANLLVEKLGHYIDPLFVVERNWTLESVKKDTH